MVLGSQLVKPKFTLFDSLQDRQGGADNLKLCNECEGIKAT